VDRDRTEAFLSDAHGRDHVTHAEMALDADGKILGAAGRHHRQSRRLHVDLLVVGADLSLRALLSGQYDIPAIYCEVDAVYTNTAPVDAYRGAGRPEATFVVERLIEVARARSASIRPSSAARTSSRSSRTRRR
jgi:aerobic carbon-monoxide dehydrogenase large subunit